MQKIITSLLLFFLLEVPVFGETSLWVAKTDSSVMYLGGSIHVLRKSDRPFPPEFDQAYNASEILVFETDVEKLNTPEAQQVIMSKAVYRDERTLDKVLSAEAYGKLKKYCLRNGLPLESMNKFKPSIIITTLTMLELEKLGFNPGWGIDTFYYRKAADNDKQIEFLETVDEQIEVITSIGEGNESAFVIWNLDDMENIQDDMYKMIEAWRDGDEAILVEQIIKEGKERFPEIYQEVFVDRNINWIPEIEAYLNTPQTEFILVGTGHLIGEDGIIAQLKKRGYKVEKLK